jgi:uncharacterized protein (DUF58 family)
MQNKTTVQTYDDQRTSDLLKRVRRIEIKTRALTNNVFTGEYHSAFKGRGMSFAEVREYQVGDDVRDIDWNVTARFNRPYIKVFEEERELTVMLVVDISGSQDSGSRQRSMRELATEIAATIAFSATKNNDKIGAIFFSDKIEAFIPPKKGRKHILYIIRQLLTLRASHRRTNVALPIQLLTQVQKRRCIAFLFSDFINAGDFSRPLLVANRRHDLVAVRLVDSLLERLPNVGLLRVFDAETGHEQVVDTSSRRVRELHAKWWNEQQTRLDDLFSRSGVDFVTVKTDEDYVKPLIAMFKRRR